MNPNKALTIAYIALAIIVWVGVIVTIINLMKY